jgi:hypothetical protein
LEGIGSLSRLRYLRHRHPRLGPASGARYQVALDGRIWSGREDLNLRPRPRPTTCVMAIGAKLGSRPKGVPRRCP